MATLMQDTVQEHCAARRQKNSAVISRVEAAGRELARYGLVVVLAWIGLMTALRSFMNDNHE
jgi:hypothetical protein